MPRKDLIYWLLGCFYHNLGLYVFQHHKPEINANLSGLFRVNFFSGGEEW